MRKVELTMDENEKYEIIKKMVEMDGDETRVAINLGYTQRHINSMINGYKEQGKAFSCVVIGDASPFIRWRLQSRLLAPQRNCYCNKPYYCS